MDAALASQLGIIGVLIPLAGPVITQLIDNIDYAFEPTGQVKFLLCYVLSFLVMGLLVLATSTQLDITMLPKTLFAGILTANVAAAVHANNDKVARKKKAS